MNAPSRVSNSVMPCGEQDRQAQDRVEGQAAGGARPIQDEQRDLGRRVEAEAEQEAQRVHLPRHAHGARRASRRSAS